MADQFQIVAANAAGAWERKLLNGRQHLVVPASMIFPGVLNGSKGPLYYTPEDIIKALPAWNGMPITLGHPKDSSGEYTSARSPEILNKYGLGTVFNATWSGKLVAEAWLDEGLTRERAPEVLNAILSGKPVELSTGLGTRDEPAPPNSVYNGRNGQRAYTHFARDHRPDHLAILVGQQGACSIRDGCGLGVNAKYEFNAEECPECGAEKASDPDSGKCNSCGHAWGTEVENLSVTGTGMDGDAIKIGIEQPATNILLRAWESLVNAFKPNQPRSLVTGKIKKMGMGAGKGEVHEAAQEGVYKSLGHKKPDEVDEEAEELPDAQATVHNSDQEIEVNRQQKVSFLVANCDCWKGKAELLNNEKLVDDKMLDAMIEQTKTHTANALIVNALKERLGDKAPALNEMPAFIKEKIVAKDGEEEEEEDEEEEAMNKKKTANQRLSYEDWKKIVPAEVVERDEAAKRVLNRETEIVVAKLTAHLTGNAKTERAKKLSALSLTELYDRLADMPQTVVNTATEDRFAILLGAPSQTPAYNEDLEVLDEPVFNIRAGGKKKKVREEELV